MHFKQEKLALESPSAADLESLIQASSLYALADYLSSANKVAVMHNADDIILGAGDLGFLKEHFAERLTLYPYGGHLGNLNYLDNGADILEFFHE